MPDVAAWVYLAQTVDDLDQLVGKLMKPIKEHNIWTFSGDLGAGKTTLIQRICARLGVVDHVHSPTFNLVNEYITDQDDIIYHFDLFRIRNQDEVLDIGWHDYIDSGSLCLIEWPEKIASLLPEEAVQVRIDMNEDLSRRISIYQNEQ
jgi:tRNA threonylcarbamoyladenosine biosynthesis protein TsaE